MELITLPQNLQIMKRILLLASFTVVAFTSMAQWAFQAQYNLWIPTGTYNSELKVGALGANVEAKYAFSEYLNGTIGLGYALLPYKTVRVDRVEQPAESVSDKAALQLIPITLGGEIFFNQDKIRPYLDIDLGVALVQAKGDGMPDTEMKINPFLSPGIGIEYELSDGIKLNGVVKQNVVFYNFDNRDQYLDAFTAVGINLGFSYKF
jgi:opacity protein-like surface antigen